MGSYEENDRVNCREFSSKISARYVGNKINLGKASYISKTCICIDTRYCFPIDSDIYLLIPFEREVVSVRCRVRSISDGYHISETVSFDILNPSKEYINYVDSFSTSDRYCQQDDKDELKDNNYRG